METINEEEELISEEGLSLRVYKDSLGYPTVGVGHLITAKDGIFDTISLEYAGKLLSEDIRIAKNELREKIPVYAELDPIRQYVLLSMCFNLGIGKLLQFKKMLTALENKNYVLAAQEMQDSKWFKQVKRRGSKLCLLMSMGYKS
jgi:lysozyme